MRKLFHYPLCGFSRIIRLIMSEKRLDYEMIYEMPWDPSKDLLDHNLKGSLPVFIDISGTSVYGISAIREYLEEAYPEINLTGEDLLQRSKSRKIADWFLFEFYKEVYEPIIEEKVLKRFSKESRGISANPSSIRNAISKLNSHIEYISWIIDRRNWLAGKDFSIADISAASFLSVLDYLGFIQWHKYETAKLWYSRIKSRPSFRGILKDNLAQIPPSSDYSNLDF